MVRIAVSCLKCNHHSSFPEETLSDFGMEPKSSLVLLTRKLVCRKCGSKAVQTFRYVEDSIGPPLVPE
jgi:hypothetical protein